MEQSYKEKYEDILARLAKAKNDNDVCDERFCCVINDLIPELAESEDEKVRKGIIELVKQSSEILNKKNQERMLAWLEKQGEKLPAGFYYVNSEGKKFYSDTFKYGDVILHVEKQGEQKSQRTISAEAKEALFDYENANMKQKDFAPNDEQKPAEQQMYWTEEEIEPIISDYLCGREHYGGMIGRLCHLKPKQKQTEWGENDKAFLDDILCKLEHDLVLNKDEKDWLKSLKGRVGCEANCTTTKEWSEEDKKIINGLIDSLTRISLNTRTDSTSPNYTFYKEIDWLKSLRPQNRWKPSETDIMILEKVFSGKIDPKDFQETLSNVLEQLKKLKEGKV